VLVESVLDREAKRHFVEAVQAYRAGAHRASIISIWIAISVDLIGKVRHLSDVGDVVARDAVAELDRSIEGRNVKGMQAFERGLIDLCLHQLQLMTARESVELQRIYEDRSLCAHRSFSDNDEEFRPSGEVVRSNLATSCDAVLSQYAIAEKR
jgi:hypothetical protein